MTWVTADCKQVRWQSLRKEITLKELPSVRPLKSRYSSFQQCFPRVNFFLLLSSIALYDISQSFRHFVFHCMLFLHYTSSFLKAICLKDQCFSTGDRFVPPPPPRGHLAMCLETWSTVMTRGGGVLLAPSGQRPGMLHIL